MSSLRDLPLPSDEKIVSLCSLLRENIQHEKLQREYASTKNILTFIGGIGVIGLSFLVPSSLILIKPFLERDSEQKRNEWKHYNSSYLKRSVRRL